MSLATASNGPEAKKFRFDLPTQVTVNEFDYEKKNTKVVSSECGAVSNDVSENGLDLRPIEKISPPNSNDNNNYKYGTVSPSPSFSQESASNDNNGFNISSNFNAEYPFHIFFQQANAIMKSMSKEELKAAVLAQSRGSAPTVPPTPSAPIPGALAVAASPAAQLFSDDDWSWHRNPVAAIRSGGTNKQTPVWKYFVYNKAENLSRCIIGDCTYMLKGPHTSTLACHLKKHPAEYAEFQKLKQEYTRERNSGQLNASNRTSQSSSNENSARHTPISMVSASTTKRTETTNSIFSGSKAFSTQKNQIKTSSMVDLLNILNSKTNVNISSLQPKKIDETLPHKNEPETNEETSFSMLPFNQMITNQRNNTLLLNLLKQHNDNIINSLNNNNVNTINHNQLIANDNNLLNYSLQKSIQKNKQSLENEKKWLKQDKKQRDVELKLALTLAASQLPISLINNSFFGNLIETLQPKFTMPRNVLEVEELIDYQYIETKQAIKMQIATTPKLSLIIDLLKVNSKQNDINENNEYFYQQYTTKSFFYLCICISYYSLTEQTMEIVFLGIKKVTSKESLKDGIKICVEEIMSEYCLSWDRILRVITTSSQHTNINEKLFDSQLESYNQFLTMSLMNIFDKSSLIIELKKSFYNMIYRFTENPKMVAQFMEKINTIRSIPLNKPFNIIAEYILKYKETFIIICNSEEFCGSIPLLNNNQWNQLNSVVKLLSLFKTYIGAEQDGEYITIDKVIPSLIQLQFYLNRDFCVLEDLPQKLCGDILLKTNYILDVNDKNFDGSFIQATALNPQLAMFLDDIQINYAKNSIEKLLTNRMKQVQEITNKKIKNTCDVDSLLAVVFERKNSNISSPNLSPSSITSESTTSTMCSDLLQASNQKKKLINERQTNNKNLSAKYIVQNYFDELLNTNISANSVLSNSQTITMTSPLKFWQMNIQKYQQLCDIAIEFLTIPSCNFSLEKIFFSENDFHYSYFSFEWLSIQLFEDSRKIERNSFLRFNKKFIPKTFN